MMPVELVVLISCFPKMVNDLLAEFLVFIHDLFCPGIGIIHRYTKGFKYPGYRGFTTADTAGDAYF